MRNTHLGTLKGRSLNTGGFKDKFDCTMHLKFDPNGIRTHDQIKPTNSGNDVIQL